MEPTDSPIFTIIVEHLDPELGPWSKLEYKTIEEETTKAGGRFILSSVPMSLISSGDLTGVVSNPTTETVENYFESQKSKICLLDPAAERELDPIDGNTFSIFLFGGILGDDPPRDRTKELRKKGFESRRLGPKQMTTDTAVRVTRLVILERKRLDEIPCVDFPELQLNEHESTEMPFRYVKNVNGSPVMPMGMLELIKSDADKAFDDLEFADEVNGVQDLAV